MVGLAVAAKRTTLRVVQLGHDAETRIMLRQA
jgi:hypothetical protein